MCELLHINKHKSLHIAIAALAVWLVAGSAWANSSLIEYHMHMDPSGEGKRVALTFDACMGKVDERIFSTLIDNKIKATIFVTGRWLKRNAPTIAILKAHSDLFEIENHGAQHVPAVDKPILIYHIPAAGSPEGVKREVLGGAVAAKAAFGIDTKWFRGSTAEYTKSSMSEIKALGFKLAGFTFSGDGGALFSSEHAARIIAKAQDGDVIITHINQPGRAAGTGVAEGILRLKAEGFNFVTLNEGF
jgi:peptidoglycan/xylan/chitin deacetylase (PgdA/CDA1 family)